MGDEGCVTGAIGRSVVRLAGDRRRLVDLETGRTARRLAQPTRRPVIGIVGSSDGFVAVVDAANGGPQATVYGPGGAVAFRRRAIGEVAGPLSELQLARGGAAIAVGTLNGWVVTSLANGREVTSPGGAVVTDVAFAPNGTAVAETTLDGVVFLSLPALEPRWVVPVPSEAVVWYGTR
jgi:hypothetical protein